MDDKALASQKTIFENKTVAGHFAALFTIIIWGTTFISTKVLLEDFQPVEILFLRFLLGWILLFIICPRMMRGTTGKQELTFAAAGFSGICLYYLLENIALTYTSASNVGVIISIAPFFTAILTHIFKKEEKPLSLSFFIGFCLALTGIFLISFNGARLQLNPKGDLLAAAAAFVWACYSVLSRKISGFGYGTVLATRKTFSYGILFMIPALFFFDFHPNLERLAEGRNLLNILYLGLGASAICFVTWNAAVRVLGAVKTSIYIYAVPVITVVTSVLILQERITLLSGVGVLLTLAGLWVSEKKQAVNSDGKS